MAAGDLITYNDVLAVRPSVSTQQATVEALITTASKRIATFTGRQFVVDADDSDRFFPLLRDTVYIDDLSAEPDAVEIIDDYGNVAAELDVATDLVLLERNRIDEVDPIIGIRLRPTVTVSIGSNYEMKVTGTWGFPAVPDDVKEAAIATVLEWLKDGQGMTVQTPDIFEPGSPPTRGLPRKAYDILTAYRLVPIG